jgi:hypothetical protein
METSAAQAFFPNKTLTYSQKLNWASQAKFKSKIFFPFRQNLLSH